VPHARDVGCANCECIGSCQPHDDEKNLQYWIDRRVNAAWVKCYSCFTCPALLGCELDAGSGACNNKRLEMDSSLDCIG